MKSQLIALYVLMYVGVSLAAEPHTSYLAVMPTAESTYLAIRVPMDEACEIIGMRWYNMDAAAEFPTVRLMIRNEIGMPSMLGAAIVATSVAGMDSSWAEIEFSEPVSSEVGDIFLALQFPFDLEEDGFGVKPGIGYSVTPGGSEAWITANGEDWTQLHASVSVKLEAIYGAGKSLGGRVMRLPTVPVYLTSLSVPVPNPFNPSTKLQFSLAEAGIVELAIFNARGAVICTLFSGELNAGFHEMIWEGTDVHGRSVPSGLYLARLKTTTGTDARRMMLVR